MVDAANPADPERRRLHDDRRPGERASLRRNRWLATEVPPRRPRRPRGRHVGSGPPGGCARDGPSPLQDRSAAALGWTRPRAFDSRGNPSPRLWSWSTIVDPGNPPLYYSFLHGWLVFGDSEAALRTLSVVFGVLTIPLVYALGRTIRDHRLGIVERAAVRDLAVPGLVLARGAGVLAPHPRSDVGDVGRRLSPSRPGTIGEPARDRLGVARLRVGNDGRAPCARHGRVPADRGERADAGLVVDTRTRAAGLPAQLVARPGRGALPVGQLASGLPPPGRRTGGVLLDTAPDRGQRAEWRLRRLRRRHASHAVSPGGRRGRGAGSPRAVELEARSSVDRVRARLRPLGAARRVDRQRLETDLPDADADLVGRAAQPRRRGGRVVPATARPRSPRSRSSSCSPASVSGATTSCTTRRPGTRSRRTWTNGVQRGDTIVFSVGFLQIPFDHYYTAPADATRCPRSGSRERRTTCSPCSRRRKTRTRVWLIVSHPQDRAPTR